MKLTKDLCTIIYYTASQEKDNFEQNVRNKLLEVSGDLPIISVSQKPLNFGHNICVGDVGVNDDNEWRQVLLGLYEAKTPFVLSAEADALYPPEYFDFVPERLDRIYRYNPVWILRTGRPFYLKKDWTEGAQIIGREYFIRLINEGLSGLPMWNPRNAKDFKSSKQYDKMKPVFNFEKRDWDYFGGPTPVISVKTGEGMRKHTGTQVSTKGEYSLPYWGPAVELEKELT